MKRSFILIPLLCSLAWGQGVTVPAKTTISQNTTAFPGTSGGGGTVAYDATGVANPATCGASTCTSHQLTWNHTLSAATDNAIFVGCSGDPGSLGSDAGITLSATFNGTTMTSIQREENDNNTLGFSQMFGLKAGTSGTHAVVVTIAGDSGSHSNLECGSVSFTAVNQTTPWAHTTVAFGSGTATTITVTSATNDQVLDVMSSGTSFGSGTQTVRWSGNNTAGVSCNAGCSAASQSAAGSASVVMAYTIGNDFWSQIGIDIPHD